MFALSSMLGVQNKEVYDLCFTPARIGTIRFPTPKMPATTVKEVAGINRKRNQNARKENNAMLKYGHVLCDCPDCGETAVVTDSGIVCTNDGCPNS